MCTPKKVYRDTPNEHYLNTAQRPYFILIDILVFLSNNTFLVCQN